MNLRTLLLCALSSGCTWLSDDDLTARLDLDGDGVPATEDCDPEDGKAATQTDGFADDDGDGAGDPLRASTFCGPLPDGWVANALDQCPDNANLTLPNLWWQDEDEDSFGDPSTTFSTCTDEPAVGQAWPGTPDCDDADADANVIVDWYTDIDGDGFGDAGTAPIDGCGVPTQGYSQTANDDCPDEPALVAPIPYFIDQDEDGLGRSQTEALCATSPPVGYAAEDGDCSDTDPEVVVEQLYYVDDDEDEWGTEEEVYACQATPPSKATDKQGDCNDLDPQIHPGVVLDICDEVDNDCDDFVDEDDQGSIYFVDADNDSFPWPVQEVLCAPQPGYIALLDAPEDGNGGTLFDCDDTNPEANPAHPEVYGEPDNAVVDNDCDPTNDRDEDGDGEDGYGGPDCDDTNEFVASYLPEVYYNDIDDDCDPTTLDDDQDGDTFLAAPAGDDCDDENAAVHPGAPELVEEYPLEGVNDNCDPDGYVGIYCGLDLDGDDYGNPEQLVAFDGTLPSHCLGLSESGLPVGLDGDCDDNDIDVNPGEAERCDGVDGNCDGDTDSALISLTLGGVLDPSPVTPATDLTSSPVFQKDWLLEVCNTGDQPLEIELDFGDLGGRSITVRGIAAGIVDAPPEITPGALGGSLLTTRGAGSLTVENLVLYGNGSPLELKGGDVTIEDCVISDATVEAVGTTDAIDLTMSGVVLDKSTVTTTDATVELDDMDVVQANASPITLEGSVAFLQDIRLSAQPSSAVNATDSSVTSVGMFAEGLTLPVYVLDNAQLVDIESFYGSNTAALVDVNDATVTVIGADINGHDGTLVVGNGGSSTFQEVKLTTIPTTAWADVVEHDLTLRDVHGWGGDPSDGSVPSFEMVDSDLTLDNVDLPNCPPFGLAHLDGGDLLAQGVNLECDPHEQLAPLFVVESGNSDIGGIYRSSRGLPPALLQNDGGDVSLRGATMQGDEFASKDEFKPELAVLDVTGGDFLLEKTQIYSYNCPRGGCVSPDAEAQLIRATNTVMTVDDLDTEGGGPSITLVNSVLFDGGKSFVASGVACSPTDPFSHEGPTGLVIDDTSTVDVVVCNPDPGVPATFAECESTGLSVLVTCDLGSCSCR